MGLVINTNLASIAAQKNLQGASRGLQASIEKLSSGLRINRASDDAAGLAISEGLKAKITSYGQAVRNANDGISLTQVGEGALNEINNVLNRMRELSVQAATSTISTTERNTIHDEYQAMKNEISRIASVTEFLGQSLLDSSTASGLAIQIGINSGSANAITVSGVDARTVTLGSVGTTAEIDFYNASAVGAAAVVVIYQGGSVVGSINSAAGGSISIITSALTALITNGVDSLYADAITVTGTDAITRVGVDAATDIGSTYTGALTISIIPGSSGGLVTQSAIESLVTTGITQRIEDTFLSVQGNALAAISSIDQAIRTVASSRGAFGAAQNRLLSTISNLSVSIENNSAANSQIRDVDFAVETANFTKYQVMQQAATAVLAQARMIPQTALQLLQ